MTIDQFRDATDATILRWLLEAETPRGKTLWLELHCAMKEARECYRHEYESAWVALAKKREEAKVFLRAELEKVIWNERMRGAEQCHTS